MKLRISTRNHLTENQMTTDQTLPPVGALSEADAAIQEIDQAAQLATDSLQVFEGVALVPTSAVTPGVTPVKDEPNRESRAKFYAKRSEDQKKRGRAELTKTYVGALSMKKTLKVNDVNIASSAERFLGLIDLAIYTYNRRGAPILGVAATEKILDQMQELVTNYSTKASDARQQAAELTRASKEALLDLADWLEPEYTSFALNADVHVKSPMSATLLTAVMNWDKAIHDLSVLHWNGKADAAQYAQLKSEERRELSALFRFAVKSLQGLRKASNPEKKAPAASPQAAEPRTEGEPAMAD